MKILRYLDKLCFVSLIGMFFVADAKIGPSFNKTKMRCTAIKKQQEESILHVPYVYDAFEGVSGNITKSEIKEVDLFLSFDCHFCKESLQVLSDYLSSKPRVRAKIYFFTQQEEDKDKICYLLAAGKNLSLIIEICKVFLCSNQADVTKDKKFIMLLKKHPELIENYEKNKVVYSMHRTNMQKKFFKSGVDKTPTWIINDVIFIEGPVDDLAQIMNAL